MLTLDQAAIPAGSHILVAVSGGADSVALLHGLQALAKPERWRLTVAHLEHGIRGKSACADAEFVRTLARTLNRPCVVGHSKVPLLAQRAGISLEMAARQARYAFLVRTARRVGAGLIATAHTADDQVETLIMKFLRGAGRGGLSGIAPVKTVDGIRIVRPLLHVTRADIESFLRARNQGWREDETNVDTVFLRNRVRHELLPLLERDYNSGLRQTLQRMREVVSAEDEWLDELARRILGDCLAPLESPDPLLGGVRGGFRRESPDPLPGGVRGGFPSHSPAPLHSDRLHSYPLAARRRVIRLWLFGQGVPEEGLSYEAVAKVDKLISRTEGSESAELTGGWTVRRQYCGLTVEAPGAQVACPQKRKRIKIPGRTDVPGLGLTVTVSLATGMVREKGAGPGALPAGASLNAAVWGKRALWIRGWVAGDRMVPFGMTGSRKIQDILVDAKVPRAERSRIPVVECDGEIIWIPGYRIAASWAVTGGPDAMNLQLQVRPAPGREPGNSCSKVPSPSR